MDAWRRHWVSIAGLLAALTALASGQAADAPARASHPYRGVTLVERVLATPRPATWHVAQIDLRAPGIRISLTPPGGSREVVRETVLAALTREGAQLAVNVHFFLPFPSDDADAWIIGLAASEGRVFSAFEAPEQSFALVADAPALAIDRRNHARIVHRRPGADGARIRERGRLWTALAGSAQILTDGRITIPEYRDAAHPGGALTPGPDGRFTNEASWYDLVTGRTIVGLSRDRRTLTLVAIDGRAGQEGSTLREAAALLIRDYGVWDALNLDGGGSTTMAWRDPATGEARLLNRSSDSELGRRVATSLLVFAAPTSR